MVGGYPITVDQHILPINSKSRPKVHYIAGTIHIFTGVSPLSHNQSIFGEILICIKKKNILKVDKIRSI